jgi:hypothetical protein
MICRTLLEKKHAGKLRQIGRAKTAQSGNLDIKNLRYQRYMRRRGDRMAMMSNTDYIHSPWQIRKEEKISLAGLVWSLQLGAIQSLARRLRRT